MPQKDFNVNLDEIEKIVFVETGKDKAYGQGPKLPNINQQR